MPGRNPLRAMTPNAVVARVAAHFGLEVEVLTAPGPGYGRHIRYARHICWWLLRRKPKVPLRRITALFGNHHATIIQGAARIERERKMDIEDVRADLEALCAALEKEA